MTYVFVIIYFGSQSILYISLTGKFDGLCSFYTDISYFYFICRICRNTNLCGIVLDCSFDKEKAGAGEKIQ